MANNEIVAAFWAKCMEAPKHDNGDPMHNALAALIPRKHLPPEAIERFRAALVRILDDGKVGYNSNGMPQTARYTGSLGVDYGPDMFLKAALIAAEVPEPHDMLLPIKTMTYTYRDGRPPVASYGYAAPRLVILPDGTLDTRDKNGE